MSFAHRLALAAILLAGSVNVLADEAADAFSSLFGADLKQVAATPDPADDVALAARLVAAAETASKQPALLVLLCDKAWELGKVHPTGHATALKAMELLAGCVPERRLACQEKVVIIRQLQYDAARGDERAKAGGALVASQQALLDLKADAGDMAGAVECGNRALLVARAVKADIRDIQARLDQLLSLQRAGKQVADLKVRLAAGPTDPAARAELVRLYLVDLDNPAEAAKYVGDGDDPATRKYVPAAAKPIEDAPELACMELGEWYRGLAAQAASGAKAAMFGRARAYYRRFLEVHTVEDLDRTKATLALNKIQDECARIGILPAPPPAPAGVAPSSATSLPPAAKTVPAGQWLDVAPMLDLAKDVPSGAWKREGGTLSVASQSRTRIVIPVVLPESYELQMSFTRASGQDNLGMILPVGGSKCLLSLGHNGGAVSGLAFINGKGYADNEAAVRPAALANAKEHALDVKVVIRADRAEITVLLNGGPYIHWEGPQSVLSVDAGARYAPQGCMAIGAGPAYTLRNMRLQVLSGEARPLRTGAPSPAQAPTPAALKRGLVLHFNFDAAEANARVTDMSGMANHGRAVGAKWTPQGKRGGGFEFGPDGQYIAVPDRPSLNPTQMTAAAWIKTAHSEKVWLRIIDKCYTNGYAMSVAGGGNDGARQGQAWWEVGTAGKPITWAASGCRVDDGQWHHIVGTAASQELRLYVDGGLVGKAPKPSVGSSACDLTIGLGRGTPVEPFPGLHVHKVSFSGTMDDVMLFNRELAPEDVKALYESQK